MNLKALFSSFWFGLFIIGFEAPKSFWSPFWSSSSHWSLFGWSTHDLYVLYRYKAIIAEGYVLILLLPMFCCLYLVIELLWSSIIECGCLNRMLAWTSRYINLAAGTIIIIKINRMPIIIVPAGFDFNCWHIVKDNVSFVFRILGNLLMQIFHYFGGEMMGAIVHLFFIP